MRQAKRKTLERSGWAVRSAQDFLGLTEEQAQYIELRLRRKLKFSLPLPEPKE